MGTGELARAHKASCFKSLFPFNGKGWGELQRCAPRGIYQRGAAPLETGMGDGRGCNAAKSPVLAFSSMANGIGSLCSSNIANSPLVSSTAR